MIRKNHLPDSEEYNRERNRKIKRVLTNNYISSPPTVTRNLDEAGIVSKTENESRDTDFPILSDIEDLTDNIQTVVQGTVKTIQVELGKQEAQFHRLKLDDDLGVITDFVIDFVGLAKNKALEFIADIETIFQGTPNITFNPPLNGLPTAFGDAGNNKFKFDISAIDTPIVTVYDILNQGGSGGGGISYPITPPVGVRGNVNTNQNINLALNTAHSTTMTLTGNIGITFTNPPPANTQLEWEIQITQDGVGGHTVNWPVSVTPIPAIDLTPNATTLIALRTNDGGVVINALFGSAGFTGNASQWATFTAVTNVDYGTFDGINIDRLRYVVDSGAPSSPDDPSTFLDSSANMVNNVASGKAHVWKSNNLEIGQLIQSGINSDTVLQLLARDNARPILRTQRIDSTPIAGDFIGTLDFWATDVTGITQERYAQIRAYAEQITVGSPKGSLDIGVQNGSSVSNYISLNAGLNNKIDIFRNLRLTTLIDIELNDNDLWIDSAKQDRIYHSGTQMNFDVDGALQFYAVAGGIALASTSKSAILPNISMTPHDLTPLSVNGNMYYDLSEQKFKAYENGAWVNMIGGGSGSQTPWLTNIDADGNSLQDFGALEFRNGIALPAGTVAHIVRDSVQMVYNDQSGGGHLFKLNAAQKFGVGTTTSNFYTLLNMNAHKITNVVDPTSPQDAATKAYVDSIGGLDGVQDAAPWIEHESTQFDFEVFMTNSKQGYDLFGGTSSIGEDIINYVPIFLAKRARLTELGFDVSSVTGNFNIAMGLYSNRTDGQNYPLSKLVDVSSVSSSTGAKTFTVSATDLEAGIYWIAILTNNNSTLDVTAHDIAAANTVGYYLETGLTPDHFLPIFGYTDSGEASLPATVENDMPARTLEPPALFAKFVFNPN